MNVTTWHNDTNRTGWQCNEPTLTQATFNSPFGLLNQLVTTGSVYAQPLAVHNVQNVANCPIPAGCDILYVADVQDNVYAFIVGPTTAANTELWKIAWQTNLAATNNLGAEINCTQGYAPPNFNPCQSPLLYDDGGTIKNPIGYVGVTGTPVIDTSVNPPLMYVVGAVNSTFSANDAIQRQALLQITPGGPVYVTFADYPENNMNNGWLFGFQLNASGTAFTAPTLAIPSTPAGTGGGFWGSAPGPLPTPPAVRRWVASLPQPATELMTARPRRAVTTTSATPLCGSIQPPPPPGRPPTGTPRAT